jgi:hypothetical protein
MPDETPDASVTLDDGDLLAGITGSFTETPADPAEPAAATEPTADSESKTEVEASEGGNLSTPAETEGEAEAGEDSAADDVQAENGTPPASPEPVTPAPAAPEPSGNLSTPPKPDPTIAERAQRAARLAAVDAEIATLETILGDDYDPYSTQAKQLAKLNIEQARLSRAELAATQQQLKDLADDRAYEAFWKGKAAQHPLVKDIAKLWEDTVAQVRKDKPGRSDDVIAELATERFDHRVATLEGVKRAEAATKTQAKKEPPPTPAGHRTNVRPAKGSGTVVPAAAASRATVPTTPEDRFAVAASGGMKGFLDD